MPAYHLMRSDRSGITMVNIGVGPANAKTITDHIAVLRPHAWVMLGHCAGLRNTQQLGDYVLAHGYVREDHVLDEDLPLWVPIPALAEVQVALEKAVADVTQLQGYELKRIMRTGTVASTDNRNWELPSRDAISTPERRFSQSRAIALDMESATIAANGFRFRVPYGTLLCVSDKPLHGEIKLPGMANHFYRERVDQHLRIGMRAIEMLREARRRPAAQQESCSSFAEVASPVAVREAPDSSAAPRTSIIAFIIAAMPTELRAPRADPLRQRHGVVRRLRPRHDQASATPPPCAGLDGCFAERLLIQPSYWSQIKARSRQIGEAPGAPVRAALPQARGLARRGPCPPQSRATTDAMPADDDERFIVGLVLSYYAAIRSGPGRACSTCSARRCSRPRRRLRAGAERRRGRRLAALVEGGRGRGAAETKALSGCAVPKNGACQIRKRTFIIPLPAPRARRHSRVSTQVEDLNGNA